ncbi:hypothetical protein PY650_17425 [Rhizobium calliandrae]|uniref:Glyoxalase/fosfomycin resistance/dioxygenase domain-containing protein n=1 Tax=Rhizobium calliandrae TaxID=1312182 RepID=A0ABT7KFN3_9HYPH|nr:VOC family protein [Rhizobium calliandrae]MDL2407412.1 hypothetical protein [Rhizobium calliandrae]
MLKSRLELFVADVQSLREFYCRVLNFQVAGEVGKECTMLTNGEAAIFINALEALGPDHPLGAENGERLGLGIEIVLGVSDIASMKPSGRRATRYSSLSCNHGVCELFA